MVKSHILSKCIDCAQRPSAPAAQTALPLCFLAQEPAAYDPSAPLIWRVPRLALTIEEAAQAVGLSRSFLYNEIKALRLKAIKPNSATRILVWDLIEWLRTLPGLGATK